MAQALRLHRADLASGVARPRARVIPRVSVSEDPIAVLLGAQRLQVLGRAEQDLLELCSDLANDEERRRCWEVYRYFTSKRTGAQTGCVRELEHEGARGKSCEDLDKLERMVYDLMSTGRSRDLYSVLKVEAAIAQRNGPAKAHVPSDDELRHEEHMAHLRSRADELFALMDTNGDGVVDREEFIIGMNMLRDELGWDEAELGTVFTAIDCHGHVSRDQFGDIVVAEELRDPAADAEMLRHVTRRSHDGASLWSWG